MWQHLGNCHGEWNAAFALAASLPLAGVWLRATVWPLLQSEPQDEG